MEEIIVITIVDYGAGNLRSVVNAINKLGYQTEVTSVAERVAAAAIVVLPGVGAAADTMANLKAKGLIDPLQSYINQGRPFLGICMGLQILLSGTEEGGWHECLGIFPGQVHKLPSGLKIPHMGWNQVKQKTKHPVFKGVPDEANFYFVHSYYAEPEDSSLVAGETEYGTAFCSVIARGNLVATQFHPERSGEMGLKIYENFFNMASEDGATLNTG
jgi:glutamine amidotransferase